MILVMARKAPISDQLRKAVQESEMSRYRISLETGIPQSVLSRFLNQGHGLSLESIDKLCECIGAELVVQAKRAPKSKKG
jgi:hypothetical protein